MINQQSGMMTSFWGHPWSWQHILSGGNSPGFWLRSSPQLWFEAPKSFESLFRLRNSRSPRSIDQAPRLLHQAPRSTTQTPRISDSQHLDSSAQPWKVRRTFHPVALRDVWRIRTKTTLGLSTTIRRWEKAVVTDFTSQKLLIQYAWFGEEEVHSWR